MAGIPVLVLVLRDQALAAAGITGEGVSRQGEIRRHDAVGHQRVHRGNKAAGVAAGVSDALGFPDGPSVGAGQFREAVGPGVIGTVGRGGIDDGGMAVFDEGNRFHSGFVGKAQKCDVRQIEHLAAGIGIFAQFLAEDQQFDIFAAAEPLIDPQSGGAGAAVNKNLGHASRSFT